ncbi:MAG: ribonuclease H-like domain-containing protein [Anaerolineales bacterium]|nr:ribonuclease H-like domain-containing protein [Anaerolineales bacterium]
MDAARGGDPLARALDAPLAALAPFHPDFRLEHAGDFASAAFVDTETTGLGAGAGVYAFLVGVGTFEIWPPPVDAATRPRPLAPTHFVVRQFFMRHPGEEAALLAAVAEVVGRCRLMVTFNGRGFDLPLLRARYRQNRPLLPRPTAASSCSRRTVRTSICCCPRGGCGDGGCKAAG